MSNLILRLAKRSLRKEKCDVKLDSVGGVGDMGCGLWGVAQSPRKEGFLEMSTLAMIHSAVRLSPGPCKGLFGYLFIFCSKCLSSLHWDALPALSPQTLLAWPLDPGFWSPALSPVSQRRSYREPSPPPFTSQAPEGPPAAWLFLSQELSQGAGT